MVISVKTGDDAVFKCSLHCADNYPHDKALSDLDVLIPSGAGDSDYMKILAETLEELSGRIQPDLVINGLKLI